MHLLAQHSMKVLVKFTVLLCGLIFVLSACQPPAERLYLAGPIMGTEYRITIVSDAGGSPVRGDEAALRMAVVSAMEAVNQSMSTYIPDSELSRFNRMKAGETLQMSDGLYDVVAEALEISRVSEGAFDATLGKAIRLWGFAEDGQITRQPSTEKLALIRESVGYEKLSIQARALSKSVDDLEVNLSAIAKGYAVDKVTEAIASLGYRNYLVDIGGELRAAGVNADGQNWRVGVEKPHVTGGVAQVVELRDQAIATSGDYRNFLTIDGERFSHTIDPNTLRPVFHRLASVSVLSERASTADALATALLTMGDEKGVAFAEQNGLAAYFIIRSETEGNYEIHVTEQFKTNLPE